MTAASPSVPRALLGLAAAASLLALCFSDALVAEVSSAPTTAVESRGSSPQAAGFALARSGVNA